MASWKLRTEEGKGKDNASSNGLTFTIRTPAMPPKLENSTGWKLLSQKRIFPFTNFRFTELLKQYLFQFFKISNLIRW